MSTLGALTVPFDTSVTKLGQGFDSVNRVVKGTVLQVPPPAQVRFDKQKLAFDPEAGFSNSSRGSPQTGVNFSMRFAESTSQLRDLLNISGSARLTKGTVSGTINGAFDNKKVTDRNKVYVVLSITVTHSIYSIDPRQVSIDEAFLPGEGTIKSSDFVNAFGDHYVQGVVIGGSLTAMLEITKNRNETTKQIEADGKVQVKGALSISGEVEFELAVSKLTEGRQTDITLVCTGGNVLTTPSTTQELIRLARRFPLMVLGGSGDFVGTVPSNDPDENDAADQELSLSFSGNAVPVKLITMPYASLPAWTSVESLQDELAGYVIDDAVEIFEEIDTAKNSITGMIAEFQDNRFSEGDLLELVKLERLLRGHQLTLLGILSPVSSEDGEEPDDVSRAASAAELLKQIPPAASFQSQADTVLANAKLRYAYSSRQGDEMNPIDYIILSDETDNKIVTGDVVQLRSFDDKEFGFIDAVFLEGPFDVAGFALDIKNPIPKPEDDNEGDGDGSGGSGNGDGSSRSGSGDDTEPKVVPGTEGLTDLEIAVKFSTRREQSKRFKEREANKDGTDATVRKAVGIAAEDGSFFVVHLKNVAGDQEGKAAFFQYIDETGTSRGFLRAVWPFNFGGGAIILDEVSFQTVSQGTEDLSYFFYIKEGSKIESGEEADVDSPAGGMRKKPSFLTNRVSLVSAESGLQLGLVNEDASRFLVLLPSSQTTDQAAIEFSLELLDPVPEDADYSTGETSGNGEDPTPAGPEEPATEEPSGEE